MNIRWKPLLAILMMTWGITKLTAQNPISWTFSGIELEKGVYQVVLTGTIEPGWATYSQTLESDMGPVPTSIQFEAGSHYSLVGSPIESGERSTHFDKVFEMNLTKFKNKAIFTQKMKVSDLSKPIKGVITYMACNEEMCLPPIDVPFSVSITAKSE